MNEKRPAKASDWLASATRQEGSWWPTWIEWLTSQGSKKAVAARTIKDGIEPAPGRYATMK
jgi:polyhydroxyalkanoate synthase